jgi:hypothetical protein
VFILEEIGQQLLEVYKKMGMESRYKRIPTRINFILDKIDNPKFRGFSWAFEEDGSLRITVSDLYPEAGKKQVAAYFARFSLGIHRPDCALGLHLLLVFSPLFLWYFGLDTSGLVIVCMAIAVSFPVTWWYAFRSVKDREAAVKFQIMETGIIHGEEEIEEYYLLVAGARHGSVYWACMLLAIEAWCILFGFLFAFAGPHNG